MKPEDGVIEMGGAITQVRSESHRGNYQITHSSEYPIRVIVYSIQRDDSTSP